MAFSYLNETNVFTAFESSKKYMRPYHEPCSEFERIARNRPHPGIDPSYPKTTDGTTSSIIWKAPKRIIQQLPTGKVKSATNDWLTIVAGFIYTDIILPHANYQYALIQKCWTAVSRALTHGSCPGYVPFLNSGDYFGPDLGICYIKDVFIEDGKLSDKDSNTIFLRAWYQESDLDCIIEKEKKLAKNAKKRGEKYESGWDIAALEKIKTHITKKDSNSTNPSESEKGVNSGGVEIIHAFQKGVGATFYSFHAASEDIVRRKVNKDPRGVIPIHFLYADADGYNPIGRGYVELVGAMQNLIDSEIQMYQYNRALQLNPPIIKRGSFSSSLIKFKPNVIIDMGTDANASVEPFKIDTQALANFPNNYGLMKSQLLNLLSSPDTSVSSEVGNPGFSKTDAGVKAQMANLSVDDNYIRKQFETWFGEVSETMINLYFAERTGVQEIQLDQATADKLRKLKPDSVSEDNKIRINFDTATEKLQFEVDASTSNIKDNADQLERLDNLLDTALSKPELTNIVGVERIQRLWNRIVITTGVEGQEELTISDEEIQTQQQAEAVATQQIPPTAQVQPQQQAQQSPPQGQPSDNLTPNDHQFIDEMQKRGFPDTKIGQALAMLHHGLPNGQILTMLQEA